MLRLLIFITGLLVAFGALAAPDSTAALQQAEQKREEMRAQTSSALQQAGKLNRDPAFLEGIQSDAESLLQGGTPSVSGLPQLPDLSHDQLEQARQDIKRLLEQTDSGVTPTPHQDGPHLYLFVSFSMPQTTLRRLLQQADTLPVSLVLRGLVDGDMNKTRIRIGELYGTEDSVANKAGLIIDPTLYERFDIAVVPTFVLTHEALKSCTTTGCDAGDHVRLSGDVPLRYALETMVKANPQARQSAESLLMLMREAR